MSEIPLIDLIKFLRGKKTCTPSDLQREFNIGYAQAKFCWDELVEEKFINNYVSVPKNGFNVNINQVAEWLNKYL